MRGFRPSVMDWVVFGFMMTIRVPILEDLVSLRDRWGGVDRRDGLHDARICEALLNWVDHRGLAEGREEVSTETAT